MEQHLWKHINLVGRSSLARKLRTLIFSQKRFVLKGVAGVGKSAMLEAAHELAKGQGQSTIIDAKATYLNILRKIADDWNLDVEPSRGTRPTRDELEYAIFQEGDHYVFVDNLHKAKSLKIDLFRALAERHYISGVMLTGITVSEELKQFLWSIGRNVTVHKLNYADAKLMTREACKYLGSKASIQEIATRADGLPGRIVAYAVSGEVPHEELHLEADEIDISWLFLILAAGIVVFRYLGRSIGATDFVLLGGAGMVVALLLRVMLQKGR